MMNYKYAAAAVAVTLVTAATSPLQAQDKPPVVVELFTSQGCYSCPPAEALLGKLAEREDVVALEFHVDYWDSLNYMWHGQWKDPFSSPEYTHRQRVYNVAIRKQSGVYTPQMVIDGRFEAVGSRRDQVTNAIRRAARQDGKLTVSVTAKAGGGLQTAVEGPTSTRGEIFLIRFLDRVTTEVKKGENHGKTLVSRHVVRDVRKLGDWRGTPLRIDLPAGAEGGPDMGCAVIVQTADQGPILGAALCGGQPSS
jgi:hypothetical protein